MTRMLQAMKHRGPDSTGYALYRPEAEGYVMHVKLAESNGHATSTSPSACSASAARSRTRLRAVGRPRPSRSTPAPSTP